MNFLLKIEPAIDPEIRHKIEKVLSQNGFNVHGGGKTAFGSFSDIAFSKDEDEVIKHESYPR